MVLSGEGAPRRVIVAIDHCLLMRPEMETLITRLESVESVVREELVVTFSHTHAAGLMDPSRAELPGGELIAPYLTELSRLVAEAIEEAFASTTLATITYATGHCSLAAHRDFFDPSSEGWVCGFDPDTPADDTVLAARVVADDGTRLATMVNYACHPTTLAWDNELISPDYPGALREVIEDVTGAPCVFLLGASGELGPREGYVGDVEVADRNGRQLAYAALETLESMPPPNTAFEYQGPVVSGATLGTWSHGSLEPKELERNAEFRVGVREILLRYRDDLADLDETRRRLAEHEAEERAAAARGDDDAAASARALAERMTRQATWLETLPPGDSYPLRASVWRIGGAVWVSVEGEPYSSLQVELRRRLAPSPVVVIVLDRGWGPCYLPAADAYGKGIYQEAASVVARGGLESLIDEIARVAGELD